MSSDFSFLTCELCFYSRQPTETLSCSKSFDKEKQQPNGDQRSTRTSSDSDIAIIKAKSKLTNKQRRVLSSSSDNDDNSNEMVRTISFFLDFLRREQKNLFRSIINKAILSFT